MEHSEKVQVVEILAAKFGKAPIAILADYRGLTVAEITDLRRKLGAAEGELVVAKNTLTRRAVQDTPSAVIDGMLVGPTALAFGYGDPVAIAKVVQDFSKSTEALELKGAVFEGELLEPDRVKELAKMPGRDELRAQLLALLMTPATQLVRLLNTPASQLAQVLDARRRQQEEQA